MKRRVLVVIVLFILCSSYSSYGEETAQSKEPISPIKNKFSIGVNDLPWDAWGQRKTFSLTP